MNRVVLAFALAWEFALPSVAHVGSPNVFFDGHTGPYSAFVVVRPPTALPGAAQVSVKVREAEIHSVWLVPVLWQAGSKGSPQSVAAQPVKGETNLWDGEVWLLRPGSYTVRIGIEGSQGNGEAMVPVNVLGMPNQQMKTSLRVALLGLGLVLLLTGVWIVQAIAREGCLPLEAKLSGLDVSRGRRAVLVAAVILSAGVAGGALRWRSMDAAYRTYGVQKPEPVATEIRTETNRIILELRQTEQSLAIPSWGSLVPDHGKLMHLFLVREPDLNVFAHLHPARQDDHKFALEMPALPPGTYQLYGDVTFENGIAQTLVAHVSLPEPKGASQSLPPLMTNLTGEMFCGFTSPDVKPGPLTRDMDDSWHVDQARFGGASRGAEARLPGGKIASRLMGGYTLLFENASQVTAGRASALEFAAFGSDGSEVALQPYMGMLGHAAVRRADGSVFAHLHPMGSFSMASQEAFKQRWAANVAVRASLSAGQTPVNRVAFPYQFPRPGGYRVWVQVRIKGRVLTGVYDMEVKPGA